MHASWTLIAAVVLLSLSLSPCGADDSLEDQMQRAAQAAQRGRHDEAIELLTAVIAQQPTHADAWYLRGRAHFCAGKVREAVADFDKLVALKPQLESRQWERGIAYYYAGEYEKGAEQFALYQTYHDQDVENSAWRYLCLAKAAGVERARERLLPIENDRRVPMMEIYALYQGKKKPADVLAAALAGEPTDEERNARQFYAHLYIGLWHDAAGEAEAAAEHIFQAEKHKIGHYMWDVAHIHAERLRAAQKGGK